MNVTEHERRLWQLQHERRLKKAEYNRQVRAKQRVVRPRTNPAKQGGTIGLQTETIALQSETIGQQGEISSSTSSLSSSTSSLSSRAKTTRPSIKDGKATAGQSLPPRGKRAYTTEEQCPNRVQYLLKRDIIQKLKERKVTIPGRNLIDDDASIRDANLRWNASKEEIQLMDRLGHLQTEYNPSLDVPPLVFPFPLNSRFLRRAVNLGQLMIDLNKST